MDDSLVDVREQFSVLRRRWRVVAISLLLGTAAAIALTRLATPQYEATTVLVIEPAQSAASSSGVVMDPNEVATQVTVITSSEVAERVQDAVPLNESTGELLESVVVEPRDDTRTVDITVTRDNKQDAASIANAFADEYIAYRQDEVIERLSDLRVRYTGQLTDISEELDQINDELRTTLDEADAPTKVTLRAERDSLLIQRADVSTQLATLNYGIDPTSPGGIITLRAEPPSGPASPNLPRALILGMTLGLVLGVALALLRDRLDDVLRDESRLRPLVQDQPILGRIPSAREARQGRVVSLIAPQADISEAYRALSTSVRFLVAATPRQDDMTAPSGRVLVVTSAREAEGKTSVATNLAVAAANAGLRVVLVDADLRRPAVAAQFGLRGMVGLTDALIDGHVRVEDLVPVGVEGLRLLAGDATPPNPAALLSTRHTQMIIGRLCDVADLVILDTAPLLAAADTMELIPHADMVVMVTRYRHSSYRAVAAAMEVLSRVGRRPDGVVLNDAPSTEAAYGYGYPLGERDTQPPADEDSWPQSIPAESRH
jgi:capsular exopolysaccharide synthesis family protein